ncbi:Nucleotide-binding universal stress protein, UspA family [Salinihabitans flavidus]|uniref:Nucleotide-binding universal stress protein, UspA family n=1 Tax=Salinihabitans flavidus TaxID=569882 RepID=A0A1H8L934_9RHOB|nr:universal stress protein [Salinihabitans flavidus]SEO01700.1 Nucleotide-binding universal stress protein, UspA family [Salinihabitans flavidus]
MTEHILVATDGSHTADRAVRMAGELAGHYGAKLTICHVLMHKAPPEELERMAEIEHIVPEVGRLTMSRPENVPGNMADLFRKLEGSEHTARAVAAIGDTIVTSAREIAQEAGARDVHTRTAQGDYAESILSTAREEGADMIVMGRRGLGTFKRLLQGSVSQKVVAHAECTVMTVI